MMAPEPEQIKVGCASAEGLSAFCHDLRVNRIAYSLAGNRTVVLDAVDWRRVESLRLGALKDHGYKVEPVVPFHALEPQAKAEVVRHKLMPTLKLLENIRARLAKSS